MIYATALIIMEAGSGHDRRVFLIADSKLSVLGQRVLRRRFLLLIKVLFQWRQLVAAKSEAEEL